MKNSTLLSFRFAAVIAAAFLSFSVSAQTSTMPLKHTDKTFFEKAAKAGMEEVDISRVMADRTTNPQVREFAQMLVSDHTSANEKLTSISIGKDVKLPGQDMDAATKWMKKDAKGLDEDYLEKMISAHKDAVELFQKEADKGEDPDARDFARDTLPKLQHHLQMALDLKKTVK